MNMSPENKHIRIVITGPESTGKTTLAKQLAEHFNGQFLPEYSREYIANAGRNYTYSDVEAIAIAQVEQYRTTIRSSEKLYFFDTWLIITKVWFEWVFKRTPEWLEEMIVNCPVDLYLLCLPDLPWEADPVRENGGENRLKLFDQYRNELNQYGFRFVEIGGTGDVRFQCAVEAVNNILKLF